MGDLYAMGFEFVAFLAQVYAAAVRDQRTDLRWCSHWYYHVAAVARLE